MAILVYYRNQEKRASEFRDLKTALFAGYSREMGGRISARKVKEDGIVYYNQQEDGGIIPFCRERFDWTWTHGATTESGEEPDE